MTALMLPSFGTFTIIVYYLNWLSMSFKTFRWLPNFGMLPLALNLPNSQNYPKSFLLPKGVSNQRMTFKYFRRLPILEAKLFWEAPNFFGSLPKKILTLNLGAGHSLWIVMLLC